MWLYPEKMSTRNFSMLLVLLMLMLRNVLTTVWSRFWSWGLGEILNLNFGHNIKAELWSRFWIIFLVNTLRLKFGQYFEAEVWSIYCEFYCEMNEWLIFRTNICHFWWKVPFFLSILDTFWSIFGHLSYSTSTNDSLTIEMNYLLNWISRFFFELNNILK